MVTATQKLMIGLLAFPLLVGTIGAPSTLVVRSRDGSVALGFDGGTGGLLWLNAGGTLRTTHPAVGAPSRGRGDGGGTGFVPGWTTVCIDCGAILLFTTAGLCRCRPTTL